MFSKNMTGGEAEDERCIGKNEIKKKYPFL